MSAAVTVAAYATVSVLWLFIATLTRARASHWRARLVQPIAFAGEVDLSGLLRAGRLARLYTVASWTAFAAAATTLVVSCAHAVAFHFGAWP